MTTFPALLRLFLAVWIAFESWLVVRDRIQHKGETGKDRGSRYYILLSIIVGVGAGALVNRNEKFFFAEGSTNGLSWAGLILAVVLPLIALLFRIRVEEKELVTSLGPEYVLYQQHTKRLFPWIW